MICDRSEFHNCHVCMIVQSLICRNKFFAGTSHLFSKKERKNYKLRFAYIVGEHVALIIGSIMYRYINITNMNKLHCFPITVI